MTVKFPWNRKLGNIGESEIKKRLSYFSKVTKDETDVRIDFVCQLCENDVLTGRYFFIQAKGTQHFDEHWGKSFEKETIQYWLMQPFPVFLVVYDEVNKECYWMSITEQFNNVWSKQMANDNKTIYIKMDRSNVLEEGEKKNSVFISKIKHDSTLINLIRGHPQLFGERYIKRKPLLLLSNDVVSNIKESVRIGIGYLTNHYLILKDIKTATFLCDFLTKFDKSHYDHFVVMGRINAFLGNKLPAKQNFEEAIRILERDKNWDNERNLGDPSIKEIIELIRKEIEGLE
jgi:hypothetical protein